MKLLIINYHYFREEKYSSGIYPISKDEFMKDISTIQNNFRIISQHDLIDIILDNNDSDNSYALITFDDGLKEQINALEILVDMNLSAVFYISTDFIEKYSCAEVHKLHWLRTFLSDNEIFTLLDKEFKISKYNFKKDILSKQYKYDVLISQKIKYFINFVLKSSMKNEFLENLFLKYCDSEEAFSKNLYMSTENLKTLSSFGMLGTHCASHQPLSKLNDCDIKNDIKSSLDFFKVLNVGKIFSISYPYGGRTAVDTRVTNIAKEFGFKFGLTMFRGINNFDYIKNNNMLLRRISCSDLSKAINEY